ncbi:type I restriction-modification system, specificity subunit [Pseudomonas alkylphenolica]|uniref:Type I restriction-modification system, specificity subunit n=2 Tax=Pseudomonas alkylphenolica TaxID=237609 RepID=A0A077F5N4_9PSED|nr:type I restriction-modification system, specificity subunit [Pseudomonas alkylphenolica]
MIPADWKVHQLAELSGSIASGRSKVDAEFGQFPVFGSTGVIGYTNTPSHTGESILVARVGANAGLLNSADGRYGVTDNTIAIRLKPGTDHTYCLLQLKRYGLNRLIFGSGQPLITGTQLKSIPIPIPAREEQVKIVTALSEMEDLISSLDQLIAKKRDIQQATMQQLLSGQLRLPGFSGAWDIKPMRALGTTYGGLAGKTKINFGQGEARYIPFMNVMTDTVIDASWLEPVDVAPDEAQNLAKKGDLFFNGSSETPQEVGFCSVLLEEIPNLYLNSFCFGFRFNTAAKVNGLFFAYWFRSKAGRAAMSILAQGATRYNIAKSAFMQLEIPQPLEEEQTAIATVLSDMSAELVALEARRDKARQLKQGMVQELLTGRIRLP